MGYGYKPKAANCPDEMKIGCNKISPRFDISQLQWQLLEEAIRGFLLASSFDYMDVNLYCLVFKWPIMTSNLVILFSWMVTNNALLHVSEDCLAKKWDESYQNIAPGGSGGIQSLTGAVGACAAGRCFEDVCACPLHWAGVCRDSPLAFNISTAVRACKFLDDDPWAQAVAHCAETLHVVMLHAFVQDGRSIGCWIVRWGDVEVSFTRHKQTHYPLLLRLPWLLRLHYPHVSYTTYEKLISKAPESTHSWSGYRLKWPSILLGCPSTCLYSLQPGKSKTWKYLMGRRMFLQRNAQRKYPWPWLQIGERPKAHMKECFSTKAGAAFWTSK